jgi:hypothetical protein
LWGLFSFVAPSEPFEPSISKWWFDKPTRRRWRRTSPRSGGGSEGARAEPE